MAAVYQFASVRCRGYSNLVIFILIYSHFHIWIASIKLWFKFEYEFFLPTIAKMADKWSPPTSLPLWTPYPILLIYYPIASKFHIWNTFIKLSPKFYYWLCQLTKMASQNGPNLSVCVCGHLNLFIYHVNSQVPNFILISFIIHSPN